MNTPWLGLVLALLGGPHVLHTGPQDPNIDENMVAAAGVGAGEGGGWGQRVGDRPGAHQLQLLPPHRTPTSARQVNGDWLSIAQASDEPKLLWKDSHMMFFVRKTHVTLKTSTGAPWALLLDAKSQGILSSSPRIQGMCVPIIMIANKTKKKFQYTLKYAGHNMIFLEEVDPSHFLIFCIHNHWHRKETVVVNLLSRTPTASCDVMQTFRNYCKSHGISPANIINLTRTDHCLRARQ
ncbi:uterocalin-like [Mirounga leonina]|uniref:uterocalin-like n=1 Tax=Mirounga leonina TaxID=9715 RepID=UPI00156C325A|nr:uterocalin-like [Mirounga leonina]